ncbi:hypothetical protein RIF29_08880 [Crotalaria pallida]|uniref:Uncharacterized protein n=1 Tax=Crotalaria pallida TaxID=3830 RepID=A0AAN9IHK9_CROPI
MILSCRTIMTCTPPVAAQGAIVAGKINRDKENIFINDDANRIAVNAEELHGDWITVSRRKRNGNDKSKAQSQNIAHSKVSNHVFNSKAASSGSHHDKFNVGVRQSTSNMGPTSIRISPSHYGFIDKDGDKPPDHTIVLNSIPHATGMELDVNKEKGSISSSANASTAVLIHQPQVVTLHFQIADKEWVFSVVYASSVPTSDPARPGTASARAQYLKNGKEYASDAINARTQYASAMTRSTTADHSMELRRVHNCEYPIPVLQRRVSATYAINARTQYASAMTRTTSHRFRARNLV